MKGEVTPLSSLGAGLSERATKSGKRTQRLQYSLIREYTLNYGSNIIKGKKFKVYSLIEGYWSLWEAAEASERRRPRAVPATPAELPSLPGCQVGGTQRPTAKHEHNDSRDEGYMLEEHCRQDRQQGRYSLCSRSATPVDTRIKPL